MKLTSELIGRFVSIPRGYIGDNDSRSERLRQREYKQGIVVEIVSHQQNYARQNSLWQVSVHLYDDRGSLYLMPGYLLPTYVDFHYSELLVYPEFRAEGGVFATNEFVGHKIELLTPIAVDGRRCDSPGARLCQRGIIVDILAEDEGKIQCAGCVLYDRNGQLVLADSLCEFMPIPKKFILARSDFKILYEPSNLIWH